MSDSTPASRLKLAAFGLFCFVAGNLFQSPISAVGDRLTARMFPATPDLRFQIIRQSRGRLSAYVVNRGSASAVIHHLQICPPDEGFFVELDSDQRIELWDRRPRPVDFITIGDLIRRPVPGWKGFCRADFVPLKLVDGERGVPAGGETQVSFVAPTDFELFSMVDQAPISVGSYCAAVLVSNHLRVSMLIPCRPLEEDS